MSGEYADYRLEYDGTVVCYFFPIGKITPVSLNNVTVHELPKGKEALVKNLRMWRHEVVVQWDFLHSGELTAAHAAALQTLLARATVTPYHQLRRLLYYAFTKGDPFDLYLGDDEYTASSLTALDYSDNGGLVWPQVTPGEIRPELNEGNDHLRIPMTMKFIVGFDRSAGE